MLDRCKECEPWTKLAYSSLTSGKQILFPRPRCWWFDKHTKYKKCPTCTAHNAGKSTQTTLWTKILLQWDYLLSR